MLEQDMKKRGATFRGLKRRHYRAVQAVIFSLRGNFDDEGVAIIAERFADGLAVGNDTFDRDRFLRGCVQKDF